MEIIANRRESMNTYGNQWKSNKGQWESKRINGKIKTKYKLRRIDESQWEPREINDKQWQSVRINGNQQNAMATNGKQQESTNLNEHQRESMKQYENQWEFQKITTNANQKGTSSDIK